ncbi:monooxygenase [Rhizobium sp. Root708]|uniref:monooxygenase n=1 Tax=Rhizobium sp. Root708 TaxID=1736592 RepID=UPI0006FA7553|nr:monooxygenase [Rhizobium sp. Root708]KRB61957.1 monooxygenase [Rhizobium sp. Root708]
MGSVSQFHNGERPVAHRIESEEEALAVARQLSASFALQSSERDINRILPHTEIDALFASGLGAVTVPPEFDGLDIGNALLGEIVAIIAEGDPSISECLERHFSTLERLRETGSESLQQVLYERALAGERFTTAILQDTATIHADQLAHRITGRSLPATALLFYDWIAVIGIDQAGEGMEFYLPRDAGGLQCLDDWDGFGQRTNGTGTLVATDVRAAGDTTAHVDPSTPSLVLALEALMHAGTALGIARSVLAGLLEPQSSSRLGKLMIDIEATAALIQRAGGRIDLAQVGPSNRSIEAATLSALAAKAIAGTTALEASGLLFELSSTATTSIGLNLDRHWRNARLHGAGHTTAEIYSRVGNLQRNDG